MNCKKCGNVIENGAAFCASCGAPVEVQTDVNVQTNGENVLTTDQANIVANTPEVNKNENMVSSLPPLQANVMDSQSISGVVNQGVSNATNIDGQQVGVQQTQVQTQGNVQGTQSAPSSVSEQNTQGTMPISSAPVQNAQQVQTIPQQVSVQQTQVQQPMQQMNQPQKKNNAPFFAAAGGLGAVMVLLICLVATGGIKLNFTVSKGGEKTTSDNQTISQENKDQDKTTTPTTTSTTMPRTTASTISNSGEYLEFSDMSFYLPEGFEYRFDEESCEFQLMSTSKSQLLSLVMGIESYTTVVSNIGTYEVALIQSGANIVSKGESTHKGLKYYYFNLTYSGESIEMVLIEVPAIDGVILAQLYTGYARESAYLDTLYEIATKTKKSGGTTAFAPDSKGALVNNIEIKEIKNEKLQ